MRTITSINIIKLILITTLCIFTLSCTLHNETIIDEAEQILKTNPYKADSLLSSILEPEELNKKYIAKWCLLKYTLSDSIKTQIPEIPLLEITYKYFDEKKNYKKLVEIGLFLGRSYIDEQNYAKAIRILLKSLKKAQEIHDYNSAGYICTYIGDIYEFEKDTQSAKKYYSQAKDLFYKNNNLKSYTFALRSIARQLAYQDSFQCALDFLREGDSLSVILNDSHVSASIYNSIGNVYRMMKKYSDAEKYLLLSIAIDSTGNTTPSYLALSDMYLSVNDFTKAEECIDKVDSENNKFRDMIVYNRYLLKKKQENYNEALLFLEEYIDIYDANVKMKETNNTLEFEKKYNKIIVEKENRDLKIAKLIYIIILIITVFILITISTLYKLYKRNTTNTIKNLKQKIYSINEELKSKIKLIEEGKKSIEEDVVDTELVRKLELDVDCLISELKRLKEIQLQSSPTGKILKDLSLHFIPNSQISLINEKLYISMEDEIKIVHPKFKSEIESLYPGISESEWRYCCLLLFGLDTKEEARLLCITPQSVRTRRTRLRKKLNICLDDMTIYEYLLNMLIKPGT